MAGLGGIGRTGLGDSAPERTQAPTLDGYPGAFVALAGLGSTAHLARHDVMPWPDFFRGLMPLWRWAVDGQRELESPLLATLAARQAVAESLRQWPLAFGIHPSASDAFLGQNYLPVFAKEVEKICDWLVLGGGENGND